MTLIIALFLWRFVAKLFNPNVIFNFGFKAFVAKFLTLIVGNVDTLFLTSRKQKASGYCGNNLFHVPLILNKNTNF